MIMNSNELFREIKKYSFIKIIGVLPFSIGAIIGTIGFIISVLANNIFNVKPIIPIIFASIMFIGIIIPIVTLEITKKIRCKLIDKNNKDLILKYLELITKYDISNNFLYYDLFRSILCNG